VKNTLQIKSAATWGSRLLKPVSAGIIAVGLFVAVVGGAQLTGNWRANDARSVAQISSTNELKGWMKWGEVVDRFKVDEAALAKELKLPPGYTRDATLKELGHKNGFETKDVGKAIEKLNKR
jgi:hypothetical protein